MHLLKLPTYICSGIMGKLLFSHICGWLIILEVDSFNLRSERPHERWVCGCLQLMQEIRGAGTATASR